jgi:hypothetical protein
VTPSPSGQTWFQSPPPTLFRYVTASRAIEILAEEKIWFCAPSSFNDPFDCGLKPSFSGSKHAFGDLAKFLAKQSRPNLARKERRNMVRRARPKLKKDFLDNLYAKWERDFLQKTGMLCLSEVCDDILMWSHYADGHTGVCLEFKHKLGQGLVGDAIRVLYAEEFPEFDAVKTFGRIDKSGARSDSALIEFGKTVFLTKSSHWSYEKEWRVVHFPTAGLSHVGLHTLLPGNLTRIIFGCRISNADKERLATLVRRLRPTPAIAEAGKKDRRFAVEIRDLN